MSQTTFILIDIIHMTFNLDNKKRHYTFIIRNYLDHFPKHTYIKFLIDVLVNLV